jgi:hypothetical protein
MRFMCGDSHLPDPRPFVASSRLSAGYSRRVTQILNKSHTTFSGSFAGFMQDFLTGGIVPAKSISKAP